MKLREIVLAGIIGIGSTFAGGCANQEVKPVERQVSEAQMTTLTGIITTSSGGRSIPVTVTGNENYCGQLGIEVIDFQAQEGKLELLYPRPQKFKTGSAKITFERLATGRISYNEIIECSIGTNFECLFHEGDEPLWMYANGIIHSYEDVKYKK